MMFRLIRRQQAALDHGASLATKYMSTVTVAR